MSTCAEDGLAPAATAFQAAWMALRDVVNAEYAVYETATDERTRRLVAVAKALYRDAVSPWDAASANHPVMNTTTPMIHGKGIAITGPMCPAWATYMGEAAIMVDLVERVAGEAK